MTQFVFESSGKMQLPSQDALEAADADSAILAFSSGTVEGGEPYWAYVAVVPSKYSEFYARSAAREAFQLEEYGTVIEMGFDAAPPPEPTQVQLQVSAAGKLSATVEPGALLGPALLAVMV